MYALIATLATRERKTSGMRRYALNATQYQNNPALSAPRESTRPSTNEHNNGIKMDT